MNRLIAPLRFLPLALVAASLGSLYLQGNRTEESNVKLKEELSTVRRGPVGTSLERGSYTTLDGETLWLGHGAPETELIFISATCPHCDTLATYIHDSKPLTRRVLVAASNENLGPFLSRHDLVREQVIIDDGFLQESLRITGTPERVVMNRRGEVVLEDGMATVWRHKSSDGLQGLPQGLKEDLILAIGKRTRPGTLSSTTMPFNDDGFEMVTFEGSEGITGFGRLMNRTVLDRWSSDLSVFAVFDSAGDLVEMIPLRSHRRDFLEVHQEDFEKRWRSAIRSTTGKSDLWAAFDLEADSIKRALGLERRVELQLGS